MCARCMKAERRPNDSYCPDCRRAYQREWARVNPQRTKRYRDQLRARIMSGDHTPGTSGPGKPGRPRSESP